MENNHPYTLSDNVDEYLINRTVDKKKYYDRYLIMAKRVWQKLFWNTLYSTVSEWQVLKKGEPYNYVDMPDGVVRLLSVATVNKCGEIITYYYNSNINIVPKPKASVKDKVCGCTTDCGCGGLCDELNSLVMTTKVLFTINNVDYIEKTWLKVCKNGDIIEYREVPVKKYNDFAGDGGDYTFDYSNDWLIGHPPFSDFSIVTEVFQRIICKLDVLPCGCPANTVENEKLVANFCSCYLNTCCSTTKKKHCQNFLGGINNDCKGTVKVSECQTKIYYIPDRVADSEPEFLLVNFQTNGLDCSAEVLVPEYTIEAMFAGIDYYSKRFNNVFTATDKVLAKYAFEDEQNKLIGFLNPLSFHDMAQVQDAKIVW